MSNSRNIVLISLDDAFSFWHYKKVFGAELQTPNLDRICSQSTAFHSAYCQSPLCGPSRASFMSGKTPPQTGIYGIKDKFYETISPQSIWPYRLKENGFFCSSGGKVHHGFKPLPPHVHDVLYSDEPKHFRIDLKLRPDIEQVRNGGSGGGVSTTNPKDDSYYHDAHSSASFAKFIHSYDHDMPFYREVGFFSPHSPFITPLKYKKNYNTTNFRKPAAWSKPFQRSVYSDMNIKKNFSMTSTRHWRKSVRNYFAAFTHGDHYLGVVWDALMSSAHADNTVVILLADHGHHVGENGRFGKSTLWEQSALVPLIIYDPDVRKPNIIHSPVALLDVGQTVLDYAGLPLMNGCVGRSLRPCVQGSEAPPNRSIPTFNTHGSSLRIEKYRFIRYRDGTSEFFDLEEDWWQQNNLGSGHSDFPRISQLHDECCKEYGLN